MTHQAPLTPRLIRLETPHYIVRTMEQGDVSDGQSDWLTDPEAAHNLNARPLRRSTEEFRAYIAGFNRTDAHLLGIFEKATNALVGMRAVYIDPNHSEFQVNVLIGNPQARGKGARTESREVVYRYFFEDMDLQFARSTVLARNEAVISGMAKRGWIHEHTSHKPDAQAEAFVELRHYRLPRKVWREVQLHPPAPP